MLIGLGGRMGAGKDAVAALLTMVGFERFAFGDALRAEVVDEIVNRRTDPAKMRALIGGEALDALLNADAAEVYAKPTTPRMRALLQRWGTEYRRSQHPGYWVDKVRREVARVGRAVVSDVRFEDEAAMIWEGGGEVWRIDRPGAGGGAGADHVSEAIPFEADRVIVNDGSMETLARRVLAAFDRAADRRRQMAA